MRAVVVFSALCALFLGSEIALAGSWKLDPATSKVEFSAPAKAPGSFFDVKGAGMHASGEIKVDDYATASGWAEVDFASVDTGNELRNTHTKGYLGDKGKLVLKPWKVTADWSKMCGSLTLKGESKEVCGEAKAADEGGKKHVEAKFHVTFADFPKVGVPSYQGASLHDGADVTVDAWAVKQ